MKKLITLLVTTIILVTISPMSMAANILVVLSDKDRLNLKGNDVAESGFYINELMQPVKRFLEEGHSVTYATPHGLAPTVDNNSVQVMYFGSEASLSEHKLLMKELKITDKVESPVISLSRVEQIGYSHFDALYVPGGQAPMNDLLKNSQLGALLKHFNQQQKITALVCHGPIALLSALPDANQFVQSMEDGEPTNLPESWIYSGYKMTAFSNIEEEASKGLLGGGEMKFYPQSALIAAGGSYEEGDQPWNVNVVEDRELITGQNPASALEVAEIILERLEN